MGAESRWLSKISKAVQMPVDPQAGLQPPRTGGHPYPCSERPVLSIDPWAIAHGYCRPSLDLHKPEDKIGSSDPRCPVSCAHKAPQSVAVTFSKQFAWRGAEAAAALARQHRAGTK